MTSEWDAAAGVYEDQFEKVTGYTVSRLLDWVEAAPGKRIADVAAGPGTVTVALAARGATVSASDFSPKMVERLQARVVEQGLGDLVDARVADGQDLPFDDDAFDGAVSNFGIIFCPDFTAAVRELARVTRAHGRVAFTAWTVEARNGWTTLLADSYADEIGFSIDPRPMYRWTSSDELRATCEAAGWSGIEVETMTLPPSVHASAARIGDALTTPATKLALASLAPEQIERLGAYLVKRAGELFGEGEVPLPREAWLARGLA